MVRRRNVLCMEEALFRITRGHATHVAGHSGHTVEEVRIAWIQVALKAD